MNRHQHPSNNAVLGAPPGASIDECSALPITRVNWQDGSTGVVSYWLPTAQELERIKSGQAIRVTILGNTHAPIIIGVDGDGEQA